MSPVVSQSRRQPCESWHGFVTGDAKIKENGRERVRIPQRPWHVRNNKQYMLDLASDCTMNSALVANKGHASHGKPILKSTSTRLAPADYKSGHVRVSPNLPRWPPASTKTFSRPARRISSTPLDQDLTRPWSVSPRPQTLLRHGQTLPTELGIPHGEPVHHP